jgi:hypothetical protein
MVDELYELSRGHFRGLRLRIVRRLRAVLRAYGRRTAVAFVTLKYHRPAAVPRKIAAPYSPASNGHSNKKSASRHATPVAGVAALRSPVYGGRVVVS